MTSPSALRLGTPLINNHFLAPSAVVMGTSYAPASPEFRALVRSSMCWISSPERNTSDAFFPIKSDSGYPTIEQNRSSARTILSWVSTSRMPRAMLATMSSYRLHFACRRRTSCRNARRSRGPISWMESTLIGGNRVATERYCLSPYLRQTATSIP